jgi:hypothetical protein
MCLLCTYTSIYFGNVNECVHRELTDIYIVHWKIWGIQSTSESEQRRENYRDSVEV